MVLNSAFAFNKGGNVSMNDPSWQIHVLLGDWSEFGRFLGFLAVCTARAMCAAPM